MIKEIKLEFLLDRDKMNLYPWYFAEECITHDIGKIFSKKIKKTIIEFKNGHLYSYSDIEQINEFGKFLFNKVKTDRKFYDVVEDNILSTGSDLMLFCNKLSTLKTSSLPNKELGKIYNEYAKKLKKMRVWGWVPPLIDGMIIPFLSNYIQEEFKTFLEKSTQKQNLVQYTSILTSSDKLSEIQTEELERLELIKK